MRSLVTLAGIAAFLIQMMTTQNVGAQNKPYGDDRADAKFVGATGGAVLGAEVVMVVEAAIGIDKVWPYVVFPIVGAGGGGVGGYFLEKKSVPGSVALLVAGIAFLIPTAIITSNAFAYNPEKEGAVEDSSDPGGQFSFELPPDTEDDEAPLEEEEGAVTEVESQPDVGPPGPAALPPPGEPAAPPPAEEAPPSETPEEETEPASGSNHRIGRGRPLLAMGSLFNFDAHSGQVGLGIPAPHISPVQLRDESGFLPRKNGVQVMVPMLYVALP